MQKKYRPIKRLKSEKLGPHSILELVSLYGPRNSLLVRKNLVYILYNSFAGRHKTDVCINLPSDKVRDKEGKGYDFIVFGDGSIAKSPGSVTYDYYTHYRVLERGPNII